MADAQTFSPIQAAIETWWKEQRPEGSKSPAPLDLPIYRELLEFAQKQLKESKIVEKKTQDGEARYVAMTPGGESPIHDDPPEYEAHSTDQEGEIRGNRLYPADHKLPENASLSVLLPVDIPFTCSGVYDYVGRNGSNTYGVFSSKPDIVTYQLKMTSAGIISGSSKDTCGPASIEGTIDCETGAVELIKRYSWCNLWAQWKYDGELQDLNGKAVILGRWESGRFAIWLDAKGTEHDKMAAQMLHVLDQRDVQSRLEGRPL